MILDLTKLDQANLNRLIDQIGHYNNQYGKGSEKIPTKIDIPDDALIYK